MTERIKSFYEVFYRIVMFLCKLFLVADVLITSYAVLGRYVGKYIPFITDPSWSEEIVLTCGTVPGSLWGCAGSGIFCDYAVPGRNLCGFRGTEGILCKPSLALQVLAVPAGAVVGICHGTV